MCHGGSCDTDTKHDLHVPWYFRECVAETDTENKLLNYRSLITLRLNH